MRILAINYEYPPLGGGGGVAHKKLVDAWLNSGDHQVSLLTTAYAGLPKRETAPGFDIVRLACRRKKPFSANLFSLLWFPIPAFFRLWRMRRRQFHVINAHFAVPSGIAGVLAKKLLRAPLVLSIHGGDIYDPSKKTSPHRVGVLRAGVRWVLRNADLVVAQSTNTLRNAKRLYGVDVPSKIIPLPYSQHSNHSPHSQRDYPKTLKNSSYTFISVGRLVLRKDFSTLIQAFAKVHARHPESRLLIVGEGPEHSRLATLIRQLKLENAASLMGYLSEEEKFSQLKSAHCYVLSSLHEGYGIVLQEAMECGLPIVSTNNGGQTDFLVHDKNALLVLPEDVTGLARAMTYLLEHPEEGLQYTKNYTAFLQTLEPNHIADQYLRAFHEVIHLRRVIRPA